MDQSIPPYLFAFTVGELGFREVGPRTRVYSEAIDGVLDAAAREFAGTEEMIRQAERLFGEYDWESLSSEHGGLHAIIYRGTARLLIPMGTFLIGATIFQGPCLGPVPIKVQIAGILKAVADPSMYEEDFWILFENINGLLVTGTGTVDGQGNAVWKYNDGGSRFPSTVRLPISQAINLRRRSSFSSSLAPTAPARSPNTDAIHISQSSIVKVSRSVISTGDDCVAIIQGSTDVSIKKVTCGPGHGFSVGSLGKYPDEKDVRGVIVTNCTLRNADNGVRIKTWGGSQPSQASNILFQDIIMDNVKRPIIIDQTYGSKSNSKQNFVYG
uniref:Exopolygalacturonase-like n=1 Tax=Populus alba TaxID=43335 RepID=A0A4U5MZ57_POPAL|nr:exopolygalacturonase-like [Populus alba]